MDEEELRTSRSLPVLEGSSILCWTKSQEVSTGDVVTVPVQDYTDLGAKSAGFRRTSPYTFDLFMIFAKNKEAAVMNGRL